ncbi:MAG: NUDIX domain-containing protein [Dehalococcoidales bacterium]|nr:NUDIX domain-containing protein [Dehalococcoidales bacterium]
MPRYRATALIIRNDKVLLVRDKGRHDYSMPGGGFKPRESTIQACIREVAEELKMKVISATRLRSCDHEGERAHHKVSLLVVEGIPHIDHKELDGFIWWDMKEKIPLQGHVKSILRKYKITSQ